MSSVKNNEKIVILFHRDLRVADHRGLIAAREKYPGFSFLPIFIFTPEQVETKKNAYKSVNSVRFMIECLEDLEEQTHGKLTLYYGTNLEILNKLIANISIHSIYETADYTPYALKRQQEIRGFCAVNSISYNLIDDCYLTQPGTILNKQGQMFQKFTPFWEKARNFNVSKPIINQEYTFESGPKTKENISFKDIKDKILNPASHLGISVRHGGRKQALKLLDNLPAQYDITRDILAIETSRLSAHNHFGTVSIREVYWKAKNAHGKKLDEFIRQLYWRDFYGHICYAFDTLYGVNPYDFWTELDPDVIRRGKATDSKYNNLILQKKFDEWRRGETGVELVDAAMKQLLTEGFIHNRARLVVADYLVKEMGVPWRWGEKWFAQNLVDYDFAQNFGNWCWVASVLPFSQAPFRRHNPQRIKERLDPESIYITRYTNKNV